MSDTQDFVTRNELDIHLKGVDDRISFNEHITDIRISAIKEMLEQNKEMLAKHTENVQAIMEKNIAEHKAIAAHNSAEISEIRGEVNALSAKVDSIQVKFGWYLALFTVLIFLAQKFFN